MKNGRSPLKRHSVYRVILISYLAILLIATCVYFGMMRKSEQILTGEIVRANQSSMQQLGRLIDDGLRGIRDSVVEQSMGTTLSGLVYSQRGGEISVKQRFEAIEIVKQFRSAAVANSFVDHMYIMLLTDGYVLSDTGKFSFHEFYMHYFGNQQAMSYEQVMALHSGIAYNRFAAMPIDERLHSLPVYLHALPLGSENKTAVMGVQISASKLSRLIEDSEWLPGAQVFIISDGDRVLNLSGDPDAQKKAEKLDWAKVENQNPIFMDIDGREYCALAVYSEVSPWKYGLIVPTDTIMHSRSTLNKTFGIGLTAMALIGVIMALYLAHRQYKPLRELASMAEADAVQTGKENEYNLIERTISGYQMQNAMLSRINRMQSEVLISQYLRYILEGTLADEHEMDSILRECGMPLKYRQFAVIEVDGSGWKEFYKTTPHEASIPPDTDTYLQYIAEQLKRTLPGYMDAATVRVGRMLYVIVNAIEGTSVSAIKNWCVELQGMLFEQFGYRPFIGISDLHTGSSGIHDAYLEVDAVREYQRITGSTAALSHQELPQSIVDKEVMLLLEGQKLTNLLSIRKYREMRELLGGIIEAKLRGGNLSYQVITYNLYGLIYMLLRAFEDASVPDSLRAAERLMRCNSVEAFDVEVNALLDELEAFALPEPDTRADPGVLVEEAVAFIQQRYADPLLSVAVVAEAQDTSPVTLARAFKRVLNMGVLDYIHHSRLHIAKHLLLNTDDRISAIAERTGYSNNVTFIRVFKKYEGITPSQYRAGGQNG